MFNIADLFSKDC